MIDFNTIARSGIGLLLKSAPGVSLPTASKLVQGAPSFADLQDVRTWLGGIKLTSGQIEQKDLGQRIELIEKGIDLGISPVPISDPRYPPALRLIDDPPPVLFVRGSFTALCAPPGVAVVGTRKASKFGLEIASRIAAFAAERAWVVVSGLALGIDAAAHRGALKSQGLTVAVLAHGLEKASPAANANLADEILEAGGVWISEHPYKTPALAPHFVQRNRIQVGLVCGSVIVEGEARSGSKTQAEYCLRSRRELFAVKPTGSLIGHTVSELPFDLIQHRGAHALASRDDYPQMIALLTQKRAWLQGQVTPSGPL